jgi:hypothetical protein
MGAVQNGYPECIFVRTGRPIDPAATKGIDEREAAL